MWSSNHLFCFLWDVSVSSLRISSFKSRELNTTNWLYTWSNSREAKQGMVIWGRGQGIERDRARVPGAEDDLVGACKSGNWKMAPMDASLDRSKPMEESWLSWGCHPKQREMGGKILANVFPYMGLLTRHPRSQGQVSLKGSCLWYKAVGERAGPGPESK